MNETVKKIQNKKELVMKNITVNITSKCNAQCKHCCFSCSPNSKDELSEEEIWKVVNYGINDKDINEIAISGGEPFLYEELILSIVKAVSKSKKIATCITNGFWATSYDVAREKLENFSSAGLRFLTISFDEFHNEYVDIEKIRNIVEASYQLPIKISLNIAVTKSHTGIKLIEKLSDSLFGVSLTRFSVNPVGNAHNINKDELYYKLNMNNSLRCSEPSSGMVIHHDGYVYPCCSPLVFESILRIGSIREYSLEQLNHKLKTNMLIYIIKKEGLNWFVDKCKEKGIDYSKNKYVSTCHLCSDLFKDDSVIKLLSDEMEKYCENSI